MEHIVMKNVHFGYTADEVVNDLNFEVRAGELVSIYGENGSGKSTLLKLMLGELKPQKGEVTILGKPVINRKSFKEVGYVPQVQNFNQITFPVTALELVVLNLYEDFGWLRIPRNKHLEKAKSILKEMGLGEYINAPYNELSGGLKQRAMIARAMLRDPKILILDEPTAGVDKESKVNFLKLVDEMNKTRDMTIVIVTHELELVSEYLTIDRVYSMEEGRLHHVTI
ncbi:MAG: ABC transporter ATP-binding protein [Tissierellia bacterium]|nr:ABC transporter ATP-binding protein [Tissierellia bacterium]